MTKRERALVCVCTCACTCVRERERDREKERDRLRLRNIEKCSCECFGGRGQQGPVSCCALGKLWVSPPGPLELSLRIKDMSSSFKQQRGLATQCIRRAMRDEMLKVGHKGKGNSLTWIGCDVKLRKWGGGGKRFCLHLTSMNVPSSVSVKIYYINYMHMLTLRQK